MGIIIINNDKKINNINFAITAEEQRHGLMNVPWPPPITVFAYKNLNVRKFWMKNTPSPLDIIFCKANKVIYIDNGIPFDESFIGPNTPCDCVIEAPLGFAESHDIKVGSTIKVKYSKEELHKILLNKD